MTSSTLGSLTSTALSGSWGAVLPRASIRKIYIVSFYFSKVVVFSVCKYIVPSDKRSSGICSCPFLVNLSFWCLSMKTETRALNFQFIRNYFCGILSMNSIFESIEIKLVYKSKYAFLNTHGFTAVFSSVIIITK